MREVIWYWRTIYRPQSAIRHFLVQPPRARTLVLLVMVYGALAFIEAVVSGEEPAGLMPVYFVAGWLGMSGGVFSVGRILGGKASMACSAIATAVPFVVPLVFMPVSIPLNYLAATQSSATLTPFEFVLLILGFVVILWWAGVTVLTISAAHGFAIGRGLVTFAASLVAGVLVVVFATFLLSFILRPMT